MVLSTKDGIAAGEYCRNFLTSQGLKGQSPKVRHSSGNTSKDWIQQMVLGSKYQEWHGGGYRGWYSCKGVPSYLI
eukprot:841152-Ditylum_brightwellii.AAC.1